MPSSTAAASACTIVATLGDAIMRARDTILLTGEGCTVALVDDHFCTIASAEYATLREKGLHHGITPLLSFLPRGGIDVHRASFEPIATALLQHERF